VENVSNNDDRPSTPPPHEPELQVLEFPQPPTSAHNFTLRLLDTKTRRVHSVPDNIDTISSRLQLMLYHRLLSALISPDHLKQLDFGALWVRLGVNPKRVFSNRFLSQARMALGGDGRDIGLSCLDDLTQGLREQAGDLDVPGVDETLQLVYRSQPKGIQHGKSKGKGKGKKKVVDLLTDQEELDLARAIEESLKSVSGGQVGVEEHKFATNLAESMKRSNSASDNGSQDLGILAGVTVEGGLADELVNDPELLWVLQESLLTEAKQAYGQGM
jgi:exonuclease V